MEQSTYLVQRPEMNAVLTFVLSAYPGGASRVRWPIRLTNSLNAGLPWLGGRDRVGSSFKGNGVRQQVRGHLVLETGCGLNKGVWSITSLLDSEARRGRERERDVEGGVAGGQNGSPVQSSKVGQQLRIWTPIYRGCEGTRKRRQRTLDSAPISLRCTDSPQWEECSSFGEAAADSI
jgi:hypothetical protein